MSAEVIVAIIFGVLSVVLIPIFVYSISVIRELMVDKAVKDFRIEAQAKEHVELKEKLYAETAANKLHVKDIYDLIRKKDEELNSLKAIASQVAGLKATQDKHTEELNNQDKVLGKLSDQLEAMSVQSSELSKDMKTVLAFIAGHKPTGCQ